MLEYPVFMTSLLRWHNYVASPLDFLTALLE